MTNLIFFLIFGLIGLWIGATLIVEATKKLALALKISPMMISLTVISIGTSLPEIATNIKSGLIGASGIAIGTNIGSDVTQITFVLGMTAIIGTLFATKSLLKRDCAMVLISIILFFLVGITGYRITWTEGVILIVIYIVYLYFVSKDEKVLKKIKEDVYYGKNNYQHKKAEIKNIILLILGLAILIYASNKVVENAITLAELWGVAQSFVGVMIIGVGTALPEFSTAITAIFKKEGSISVGTLIGSNITDPLFSMGFGAIASGTKGLFFAKNLLFFDIPFWFIASLIALLLLRRNMRLERKEGFVLLFLYALFIFLKIKFFLHY